MQRPPMSLAPGTPATKTTAKFSVRATPPAMGQVLQEVPVRDVRELRWR